MLIGDIVVRWSADGRGQISVFNYFEINLFYWIGTSFIYPSLVILLVVK